jgi:hypothetical protein
MDPLLVAISSELHTSVMFNPFQSVYSRLRSIVITVGRLLSHDTRAGESDVRYNHNLFCSPQRSENSAFFSLAILLLSAR